MKPCTPKAWTSKADHCVNWFETLQNGEENPAALLEAALLRLRVKTDTEFSRFSSDLQALLLSDNFRIKIEQ